MEQSQQLEVDAGRRNVRVSPENQGCMELIIAGQESSMEKEPRKQLPLKLQVNVENEYKTIGRSKSNLIIFYGKLFKRHHGHLIIENNDLILYNP
jgi:hypothetical protein